MNLCRVFFLVGLLHLSLEKGTALTIPTPQKVIIVGGGVGGLAVASRIATSVPKCEVLVIEKNEQAGGRCGSFYVETTRGCFRHERGPSLLLLPDTYRQLFADCGSNPEDCGLKMVPCVPAYQAVFDDGDRIELGFPDEYLHGAQESRDRSRAKMDSFESDGAAKWDEYMEAAAAFLDCGLPNFIEERLDLLSFPSFLFQSLRENGKAWPLKPHSDVLDATFESDKMKAMASFQDLYVGLEPYRNGRELFGGVLRKTAPAVFSLLAAIELHPNNSKSGVFAPIGGFSAVTGAFESLARQKGVHFKYQSTVTKVTPKGVHVTTEKDESSTFLEADLVVINADLPYATETILPSNESGKTKGFDWDDSFDFSSGAIAFHWSITRTLADLNTHNVFLAATSRDKSEKSWRLIRSLEDASDCSFEPFNFYVHRACKADPTAAPEGCEALLVLVPCKTLIRKEEFATLPRNEAMQKYKEQFDGGILERAREAVLQRFECIDSLKGIKESIIHEVVDTPGTYADQYNVGAGTPFALSHGFSQLSIARPSAESSAHDNVLFVGASSRPGNGVPLVLSGAKLVAEKVVKKLRTLEAVEKDPGGES